MRALYLTVVLMCFCLMAGGCGKDNSLIITAEGERDFEKEKTGQQSQEPYASAEKRTILDSGDVWSDAEVGTSAGEASGGGDDRGKPSEEPSGQGVLCSIYVYVCGHVAKPGVYALEEGDRICDALALAGGVTEDGRGEALSQAARVVDGQTIYVPGVDEDWNGSAVTVVPADFGQTKAYDAIEDSRVDINQASREELMSLPGIGESKASDILKYREEHGGFQSVEELMNIPGIKEGVFRKLEEYVKV